MSIKNITPREIAPTHPGEMLREDFMPDFNLTTAGLAKKIGVSRQTINELLLERRAVSPAMALRLSRLFVPRSSMANRPVMPFSSVFESR